MGDLTERLNNYQSHGSPNSTEAEDVNLGQPKKRVSTTGFGPLGDMIVRGNGPATDFTPETYVQEAAEAGWGESRYDKMTGYVPGANIEDVRANAQPWYWKIGNGVAKGGVTAATTAVNTLAGTVFGAGASLFEFANELSSGEGVDFGRVLDAGVNNFLSEQLIKIQNYSEELFPNYRTEEEQSEKYQKEWYKHLGTANFIGDSFLKNFGFTVGAMAGGAVWANFLGKLMAKNLASNILKGAIVGAEGDAEATAALKNIADAVKNGTVSTVDAKKLVGNLEEVVKKINRMDARLQLYGATIGAMGEGTTEGIMAKDEFLKEYMPQLEREYRQKMANVEKEVLNSDPVLHNYIETGEIDEDGNPVRILTEKGRQQVNIRKNRLAMEFSDAQAFANDQGDRLASTTFMLNLPLLTASNTIQFGRMFSNGWKAARKQALEGGTAITKSVIENGKYAAPALKAAYNATGNVAGKTVLNSLKLAGTESFEEMAQGVISSGAKNVAARNLAAFNNDAYDPDAVGDFGDWFGKMSEGGIEYLSDVKNWQEGFLGAVTGLLGIPSRSIRTWNGGVIGAYNDAKSEKTAADNAANILNAKVNSQEFQDRWHGYIRHMKYDRDMRKAADENKPYDWHNANDKQLINDIIAFDDAGKLDDLLQIVDAYSEITTADAEKLKSALGNNRGKMSNEDIVKEVKDRAESFKESILEYKDLYDALSARAKPNTSKAFFEETLFTANQIKLAEKRFLKMFDETIKEIDKAFGKKKEDTEELENIHNALAKYFTGNVIPGKLTEDEMKRVDTALDVIEKLGKNREGVKKKVEDMRKLSSDRADLMQRLTMLKGVTQEEFDKAAITPDKVAKKAINEQIRREAGFYTSVEDVKVAYRGLPKDHSLDQEFFDTLVDMQDENPHVKAFLDFNASYQDFYDSYKTSQFRVPPEKILASSAQNLILKDIYESLNSSDELKNLDMKDYLSDDPNNPTDKEKELKMQLLALGNPEGLTDIAYAKAIDAVRNGLDEYRGKLNYVTSRPVQKKKSDNKPVSLKETVGGTTTQKPKSLREVAGVQGKGSARKSNVVKDKLGREWNVGQKVYMYKLDDDGEIIPILTGEYTIDGFFKKSTKDGALQARLVNGNSRILVDLDNENILRMQNERLEDLEPVVDDSSIVIVNPGKNGVASDAVDAIKEDFDDDTRNEVDTVAELNGKGDLYYLRTGMPEIDSWVAKRARDIASDPNLSYDDKKKKLAEINLSDFFIDHPEYAETWHALQNFKSQNAFENVANVVERGDKIEFRINDEFPKLHIDGQPDETQILLYTRKDGKEYLLTTLVRDTSLYHGLQGLKEAIFEKYNKWKADGGSGEFIFKDDNNEPITTTVWSKRNGIVVYNQNDKSNGFANEKSIRELGSYDVNAPIVYVDSDGIKSLNGKPFDASSLSSISDKLGHLYYLAKGNNGKYIVPIRLGVEHLNKDTKQYTTAAFNAIKSALGQIADYVKSVADTNIASAEDRKAVRDGLNPFIKGLASVLDIHEDVFTLYADRRTGKTKLAIYSEGFNKPARIDADKINVDWLLNTMAYRNRSININSDTDINSLVEQDLITTNAVVMRPKGVDFYTYAWDEESGSFKDYRTQKTIAEKPVEPEEKEPESVTPTKEELDKEVKDKKKKKSSMPTEKKTAKPVQKPKDERPAPANVVKSLDWKDFPKEVKDTLMNERGWDEESWNSITEAAKRNELDCIGVSF